MYALNYLEWKKHYKCVKLIKIILILDNILYMEHYF